MDTNIKTWQERADYASRNNEYVEYPQIYMKAEIAELRAALAATQAPSAPVAPDEQKVELMRSGLALMVELKKVKADRDKVLEEAYGALLWLHRRLPAAYKPLATIDQTIESIGGAIGYDARESLAERAALSVKAEPAAIQEGWQLVPKDPTGVMKDQGSFSGLPIGCASAWVAASVYRAMLAAAPTPPTTGEG